jgi:hypothetical protein
VPKAVDRPFHIAPLPLNDPEIIPRLGIMRIDFDSPRQLAGGCFGIMRAIKRHALLVMTGCGCMILPMSRDDRDDRQTRSRNRSRRAKHTQHALDISILSPVHRSAT